MTNAGKKDEVTRPELYELGFHWKNQIIRRRIIKTDKITYSFLYNSQVKIDLGKDMFTFIR